MGDSVQADPGMFSRRRQLTAFASLLCLSIGADFSVYVAGVSHVYLHDASSMLVGILGVALAVKSRTLLPGGSWFRVPIGLFAFILVNTVVIGAFQYPNVPARMHKLFWFEHGDAIRIIGELFAWVWTFGLLRPTRNEAWLIVDIAVWGSAVAVGGTVIYSIATNSPHATTTTFDVDILTGLPLAAVFALRSRPRPFDLVRLAVFAAGSAMLYSRATIVTVLFTTLAVLIAGRGWRRLSRAIPAIAAGFLVVFLLPHLLFASSAISATSVNRVASLGDPVIARVEASQNAQLAPGTQAPPTHQLAPYTIPTRVEIWKDALDISLISPVMGVGYHDYFLYSSVQEIKDGSQATHNDLFSSRIKSAHSDYLSWLAETGVLGLAVLIGFWGTALVFAVRAWRKDQTDRIWHTFTLALIISFLGISTLGEALIPRTPEAVPQAAIWWIVLALLFLGGGRKDALPRPTY